MCHGDRFAQFRAESQPFGFGLTDASLYFLARALILLRLGVVGFARAVQFPSPVERLDRSLRSERLLLHRVEPVNSMITPTAMITKPIAPSR